MYKKKQLLKKYTGSSQEDNVRKQYRNEDLFPDIVLTGIDAKNIVGKNIMISINRLFLAEGVWDRFRNM